MRKIVRGGTVVTAVDQFNIYLMTHGQEQTLRAYGEDIIPRFAGAVGGTA